MSAAVTSAALTSTAAGPKDIQVLIGVDVDAVAGWLGSYGGAHSPSDIQRGMFAGEVGSPRLLTLLERRGLRSTWFVPGHSLETFPGEMKAVADAGHEIGAHGYAHENPIELSEQQERAVMERSVELITAMTGRSPVGYVAPWWETSERGAMLLREFGFSYGHSQNYRDFLPFYARVGDTWTIPDYSQPAETWMLPLVRGREIDIVEFCGNWYLDDLPPMMFIKQHPNSHGFVSPRDIEQLWKDQFDWVYRELDYAVLPVTLHPDVSGRPQVLLMLERFFDYLAGHAGVRFITFEEAAADFRRRVPFVG
jgi:peptidoglycan/xylan/chitin deacetylase (PgdA/CDA1 family)